jgi:anthranilate phosphoribosyltransferase
MERVMEEILRGEALPEQLAAFLVALRMRGETVDQMAAAARVMRRHASRVDLGVSGPILDTCGTGGDGAGTFNISTVSAIVAAACGVRVAKHGNRAVSSRAGSADVLEALGVRIEVAPEVLVRCVREAGIGFLFAPRHHGALRHAAPVRRSLGIRTFFNLLGPLANPANATHQLLGVYDPKRLVQVAEVLGVLGVERAWVVHGAQGLDEISPAGPTDVAELSEGVVRLRSISPADFGLGSVDVAELAGGDARQNARIALEILEGQRGSRRDAVLMNASAALNVVGCESDLERGARRAAAAIDDGSAKSVLDRWIAITQG